MSSKQSSIGGVIVSIAAFQAGNLGLIPGQHTFFMQQVLCCFFYTMNSVIVQMYGLHSLSDAKSFAPHHIHTLQLSKR